MGFIAAAVVAAGATAYAAKSASDSAADANKANQESAQSDRELQYKMWRESRGANGHALLPDYFAQSSEGTLANRAMQQYLAQINADGTPEQQIKAYQAIADSALPSLNAGDQLVHQLFSGELENQQVANIAPVLAARGDVAKAQKQGILEGLMVRLNALSADRARQGYTGGGSAFQKNLLIGSTIPALQGAATVGAQADLSNATDVANIRNAAIATRLNNLGLPMQSVSNRVALKQLPGVAAGAAYRNAVAPLDWFKLNMSEITPFRSPTVTPVPGMGQIVGSAISSGASTLGNYFANRAIAQQLTPQPTPYTVGDYMQNQRMIQESTAPVSYGGFT